MNKLIRKSEKWRWEEEQQKVFEQLKRVFTTRPVLVAPNLDKKLRVEADTSNFVSQMVTYLFVIEELGSFNKSRA